MRAPGASIVAAVALAIVSDVSLARADDATEKAALLHLERGVAAFKAGDYLRAHRELEAAHDLAPDRANPYRWLALTEIQLGDCQRALINIEGFLARVKPDEPRVAELVRLRDLCQRTGVLRVDSTPPRVALHLDGAYVGMTPFRALSLQSGSHTLRAEARGHRPAERTVELPAGGTVDVHLNLAPADRPMYRRWQFWAAVGAVAAVATAGVVLASSGGSGERPVLLPPIACLPEGCEL